MFKILLLLMVLFLIFNPFGSDHGNFFAKGIYFQYKNIKKEEKENRKYNQRLLQECVNSPYRYEHYRRKEKYTAKEIFKRIICIDEIIIYFCISILCSILVTLLVSAGVFSKCEPVPYNYSFEIKSLKDNMVTSGEFYRGHKNTYGFSGSVNGSINYYFLREMEHGDKIGHIPADMTYIYYDNEATPSITVQQTTYEPEEWMTKWFWNTLPAEKKTERYILTVPENTILMNDLYQIDMQ